MNDDKTLRENAGGEYSVAELALTAANCPKINRQVMVDFANAVDADAVALCKPT